jgi:membrane fusion protein (multidrug efflux system)
VASTPANRTPLIVLSIAGLVIAASCWGLYSSEGAVKARERDARLAEAEQGAAASEGPRTVVDVVTVKRAPAAEVVELSGVLEAIRSTWVAAEIAGSILAVPAKEHTPIEQGGVLVRLDPALPRAELIRAQASYDLAKAELDRQQQLGTQSVASKAELDRAVAEERRSYAALLEARARLGHTTISAPFDGLVNSLDLDPGAFVSPGTPIAEVLDVSTLELTVPVSDRQIGAIAVGDVARVRVDPLGNRLVEGKVVRKGRAPQAETQRYPVVIELSGDEAGRALLPGMLAHAMLEVGTAPTIRLPSQAVIRQFELDYVYEIDSQDVAKRVRVSTRPVPFRPDQVEVQEGLADGARVAVSAISQLRNGVAVDARAVPAP